MVVSMKRYSRYHKDLQKGSRLIKKNLGVSGLFQDFESLEVICGVLQAAILDSCQQVAGLVYF